MSFFEPAKQLFGRGKSEVKSREETIERFGWKFDTDKTLYYRQDAVLRLSLEQLNELVDVADRIKLKLAEINAVHRPWGRSPDNIDWRIRYNAFLDLIAWWHMLYNSRRAPKYRQEVLIEQDFGVFMPDMAEQNFIATRTVKKRTAEALQVIHGEDKVRIVKTLPLSRQVSSVFNEEDIEEFAAHQAMAKIFRPAESLIGWTYPDKDVSVRTTNILYGVAQSHGEWQGGPAPASDFTGGAPRPASSSIPAKIQH